MRGLRRFDQGRHWRERGAGYVAEFERHSPETARAFDEQEEAIRRLLREPRFSDVRSVLEIGAGFGRVTGLVLEVLPAIERYVALDISADQIAAARARLSGWAGKQPDFVVGDFRARPETDSFDLVLAAEVFLHFPPAEVTDVVRKAQRLSRRFLVHVDPFPTARRPPLLVRALHRAQRLRSRGPTRTDWAHDYPLLYDHGALRDAALRPIAGGSQHLFVVEREG
jgi:SAM-dependent methyltransferase